MEDTMVLQIGIEYDNGCPWAVLSFKPNLILRIADEAFGLTRLVKGRAVT